MHTEVSLRQAGPADLAEMAEVHLAAREAAVGSMPALVHPADAVREHFARLDLVSGHRSAWVAHIDEQVVGYALVTRSWLDDLYIHPGHQRSGIGDALFSLLTALHPDGLCLWVFESNHPARTFYRERGCIELERTDGSDNEEKSPDIRVAWPGVEPLVFLRRLIDEVDESLGGLLARRTALTRAVQQIKPTTARDSVREAEIVARMARAVPSLPAESVAVIVDVIISESLRATSTEPHA